MSRWCSRGYRAVAFSEAADIYIINTCTVTAKSDAESRRLIRRAARLNPEARVVVTGCYAQLAAAELAKLPNVSLVLGNSEKRDIARLLAAPVDGVRVTGFRHRCRDSSSSRFLWRALPSIPGHFCRYRTAAMHSVPTASYRMPGGEVGVFPLPRCWPG